PTSPLPLRPRSSPCIPHPRSCRPAALADNSHPSAHRRPLPSSPPAIPPSSSRSAPRTAQPFPLAPPLAPEGSSPTDSLYGSTLRSSLAHLRTPPPPRPLSPLPAPRITRVHTDLADNRPPFDSTPRPPLPIPAGLSEVDSSRHARFSSPCFGSLLLELGFLTVG